MMKYRLLLLCMLCISLLGFNGLLFAEDTEGFRVIVHVSNPHSELSRKELSHLFLKKITRWKEFDEFVSPVNLEEESSVRELFAQAIHRKKISAIKAYWQQQIFSGREIPPLERSSDEDVLTFVSQKKGAIGYVSKSADLSEHKKIKAVKITEE